MLLTAEAAKCIESWAPVNDRIIRVRLHSKYIKTSIVQIYAPTNEADEDTKEEFYEILQRTLDDIPKHDMVVVMGDWNAKVGYRTSGEDRTVGKHVLRGDRSDNGERAVQFCTANNLALVSTMFPHKDIHKYTWVAPGGRAKNQIDHIAVSARFKRTVTDTRAYRGADIGCDHNLVIAGLKLKLSRAAKGKNLTVKYDDTKLRVPEVRKRFKLELRNRFQALSNAEREEITSVNRESNVFSI